MVKLHNIDICPLTVAKKEPVYRLEETGKCFNVGDTPCPTVQVKQPIEVTLPSPLEVEGMTELLECLEGLKLCAEDRKKCIEELKEKATERRPIYFKDTEYSTPEPECKVVFCRETLFNCAPFTEAAVWLDEHKQPLSPQPTETEVMALTIYPLSAQAPSCERVDVLPFEIVGPAAAQDYTAMLTAALAANPVSYATFGAAAATDEVLAFNAVEKNGGGLLYNGIETPMINDPDGVNMANELEVPDGCTAVVTFCLQKCLTKAEVAAL